MTDGSRPIIIRTISTNKLTTSPHYAYILREYTKYFSECKQKHKRTNDGKFFLEVVLPLVPGYNKASWYQYLRRFKTDAGIAVNVVSAIEPQENSMRAENDLGNALMTAQQATQTGINAALNIGAKKLNDLMNDPAAQARMSVKDVIDLLFKAMKAQDSRIQAVKSIKEDNREQAKFDRAFNSATYGNG